MATDSCNTVIRCDGSAVKLSYHHTVILTQLSYGNTVTLSKRHTAIAESMIQKSLSDRPCPRFWAERDVFTLSERFTLQGAKRIFQPLLEFQYRIPTSSSEPEPIYYRCRRAGLVVPEDQAHHAAPRTSWPRSLPTQYDNPVIGNWSAAAPDLTIQPITIRLSSRRSHLTNAAFKFLQIQVSHPGGRCEARPSL